MQDSGQKLAKVDDWDIIMEKEMAQMELKKISEDFAAMRRNKKE